jgi:hypothetical protein
VTGDCGETILSAVSLEQAQRRFDSIIRHERLYRDRAVHARSYIASLRDCGSLKALSVNTCALVNVLTWVGML